MRIADRRRWLALAVVLGVVLGVVFLRPRSAEAASERPAPGGLFAVVRGAPRTPSPLVKSTLELRARGPLVEATSVQHYVYRGGPATEAVYIFPLPADATVSSLVVRVGGRVAYGRVEARSAARRRHERAVARGVVAALLEQERPDVFSLALTGLTDGTPVEAELRWDAQAVFEIGEKRDVGAWRLTVPTLVAPRYVPGRPTGRGDSGRGDRSDTDQSPDASRVTPPVDPSVSASTEVTIALDPRTRSAECLSISCTQTRDESSLRLVAVAPHDRDFVVRWISPEGLGWSERDREDGVVAVAVIGGRGRPRSSVGAVLAVDVSRSTEGRARLAARQLVRALGKAFAPSDRYAIDTGSGGKWRAAGGAEVLDALGDDVKGPRDLVNLLDSARVTAEAAARLGPEVVLVSDGLVTNDKAVIDAARRLGHPVHTVAVGAAPNHALLTTIAAVTGGTARTVHGLDDADDVAAAVAVDLRHQPAPTAIEWGTPVVDVTPVHQPRLGVGQGRVVLARLAGDVRGRIAVRLQGRPLAIEPDRGTERVALGATTTRGLLARRWAQGFLRDKIVAGAPPDEIARIGLGFGLVSPQTALVAVDDEVAAAGGTQRTVTVPVPLPAGMRLQSDIGGDGDGRAPAAPPADAEVRASDSALEEPSASTSRSDESVRVVTGGALGAESTVLGRLLPFALTASAGWQFGQPSSAVLALDLRWTTRSIFFDVGAELGIRTGFVARSWAGRALLVTHAPLDRWFTLGTGIGVELGPDNAAFALAGGGWIGPSWLRAVIRADASLTSDHARLLLTTGIEARF